MLATTPLRCSTGNSSNHPLLLLLKLLEDLDARFLDLDRSSCLCCLLLSHFLLGCKELFTSAVEGHDRGASSTISPNFFINWNTFISAIILAEIEDIGCFVVGVFDLKEFDTIDFLIWMNWSLTPARFRILRGHLHL